MPPKTRATTSRDLLAQSSRCRSTDMGWLRCVRLASRRPGGASISTRAALSAASSVSAAEIKTTSAGVWPRSTASLPSSMAPGVAARRCIRIGPCAWGARHAIGYFCQEKAYGADSGQGFFHEASGANCGANSGRCPGGCGGAGDRDPAPAPRQGAASGGKRRLDRGAVKAGLADDHQTGFARFTAREGAVEVAVDAGADGLKRQAHGFARDGGEAFEAQDVMGADHIGHLLGEPRRIGNLGPGDDETFEIVMVVIMVVMVVVVIVVVIIVVVVVVVMHLVPGLHIALGPHPLAQKHIDGQRAHGGFAPLHANAD